MVCVLCRLLPLAIEMSTAQFYTSVGPKSEGMIKYLITANKISDVRFSQEILGLLSIFKLFSTPADCKRAHSLNGNKPKDLGLCMSKIQPLCFILYNPKCGYFSNYSPLLTSRLQ